MARKVKSRRKATSGKRTQSGRGVMDLLRKAHSHIKANKLISRGLRMAGKPGLANAAAMMGYGKKRKKRRVGISVRLPRATSLLKVPRKRRRTTAVRGSLMPKSVMRGRGIAIPGGGIKTLKGRGFIGKTLGGVAGGLLGGLLPF